MITQLWPALAEKAYASAYGSYAAIEGGECGDALSDLTGMVRQGMNAPYVGLV